MSARIICFPALETSQARRIIANPDDYDEAIVLDACEQLQRFGTSSEQQRARARQSVILRKAIAEVDRKAVVERRLAIVGDVVGAGILFGLLYLFFALHPGIADREAHPGVARAPMKPAKQVTAQNRSATIQRLRKQRSRIASSGEQTKDVRYPLRRAKARLKPCWCTGLRLRRITMLSPAFPRLCATLPRERISSRLDQGMFP